MCRRWSSASTASTIRCNSSSSWRARTNSAGACRVLRTSARCSKSCTGGSAALRARIRSGLRGQFTESPTAHLFGPQHRARARRPAKPTGTQYAEAPVLNSQQLVLTFQHPPNSHFRWDSNNVEIGVKDRGVYLVEAVRGELRAYTILMVSDLVMITKTGKDRIVNFVADRNSGEPVQGAELFLLTRDLRKATAETDADGFAEWQLTEQRPDDLRLVARSGAELRGQHAGQLRVRDQPRALAGLHLHGPSGLPSRPYSALQGNPAAARDGGLYRRRWANRCRWKFRMRSRSRCTRRR